MSFPDAMSGWPEHMYVVEGGKRVIRCLAEPDCKYKFRTNEFVEIQVNHYAHDLLEGDYCKVQHSILKQMHTLKLCLVCSTSFKHEPDARALFKHVIQDHPNEADMSTIPGFLIHVRKFAGKIPADSPDELEYRKETFKVAFEHLKLHLTTGKYRPYFKTLMGYPHNLEIPDDKLREVLTAPDDVENFPIVPGAYPFAEIRYETYGTMTIRQHWHDMLRGFQEEYRKGKI